MIGVGGWGLDGGGGWGVVWVLDGVWGLVGVWVLGEVSILGVVWDATIDSGIVNTYM